VSPLDSFVGDLTANRASVLYQLGLAVVAFLMVLLPTIYVGLILLAGWGVYWHATNNFFLLVEKGGVWFKLVVYGGPLIVGITLIVFMVKPFFAKRPQPKPAVAVEAEQERLLFGFIERICRLVGAPLPRRVEVNCMVNAAASFRRGAASFFGQDLTLTIGLPLVAGLNMRQFAGVLGHEFGHFTQGAGMRLTYLIRRINYWFYRVVYERDQWDLELESGAKAADLRIGVVLHAARGCVWLSRRILWALMHAGHAVSCFMLRQMEYDADRWECQVAGSDSFRETVFRIQELNLASQAAFGALRDSWREQRLPDSLPLFIVGTATEIPAEVRAQIGQHVAETKTGVFDTHPADRDRIRAAETFQAPGVFRFTDAAAALFRDFPALSRQVTRFAYEKEHELAVQDQNLVDTETCLRASSSSRSTFAVFARYFDGVNTVFHPISISPPETLPLPDSQVSLAELQSARERMKAAAAGAKSAQENHGPVADRLVKAHNALALMTAGFTIKPAEFELEVDTLGTVAEGVTRLDEQRQASGAALEAYSLCAKARLRAALQLLNSPSQAGRIAGAPALQEEVARLVPALAALTPALAPLHQLGRRFPGFQLLLMNRARHSDPARVDRVLHEHAERLRSLMGEVSRSLNKVPYPFSHARGPITLAQYVQPETSSHHEWEAIFNQSLACLERLFPLYDKVLARLAQIATQVEDGLAPEPTQAEE
jgi:Zn-dependent protease with chaperone function